MGQQMCSMNSQQLTTTLNQLALNESEIPQIDEEDDHIHSAQTKFNFLKTEVVASWNILQQPISDRIDTNYTFATDNPRQLTKQFKSSKNVFKNLESTSNQKLPQQHIFAPIQNFLVMKYKDQPKNQMYQNLQIDMSNFIKIRTQNIKEFYDFGQKVGQGTFGNVYRCVQKRTGEVRAIKALKKKTMNNASKMSLMAQIDLLKTLDHPNVVKLYDLFLYDGSYYVITEFCEGGSLQKYFIQNKGHIPQQIIKIIMKQLVSVMNYLYSASVVHRDLKPQNVVFLKKVSEESRDFQIRIIDFGTATKIQKHKKTQSGLVGTLLYIAPQFTKGFFTQKCDIWSAGVMFYRLLFNDFPFKGRTQKQVIKQITTKQIQWEKLSKTNVSAPAIELLKLMLDKNHLSRASSKTLVQHPWIRNAYTIRASKEMSQSAASSLALYNRKNNFVSVIESFLSFKKVTQQQRHQLAKMFFEIDIDHSGLIEVQQLIEFFKKKYPQIKETKISEIVQNVDKNNSGKIDFNEFITAMAKKSELFAEQALKEAFHYVDRDGTGFITKKELKMLLKVADKREIDEVYKNLDEDGDNQISFQEFRRYLLSS